MLNTSVDLRRSDVGNRRRHLAVTLPRVDERSKSREPGVIGWREWVALPQLGVEAIKAKVDTGARSSSLHAFDVHEFEEGGIPYVSFRVHPIQRETHTTIGARAQLSDRRIVRNPGGREELRPVIVTNVAIGDRSWPIELTLTRRDAMGFRMLLGRQAVRRRFVVDPGRSYLTGAQGRSGRRRS